MRNYMKETILVVDDDETVLKVICRHLAEDGYNVLEARTPADALSVCGRYKESIDLLLSDLILPEMTGQELFRRITGLRPGIKVIFVSGDISAALSETAVPLLQKPFSGEALVREVRKALQ